MKRTGRELIKTGKRFTDDVVMVRLFAPLNTCVIRKNRVQTRHFPGLFSAYLIN